MDRLLLLDAGRQLEILGSGGGSFARSQGVSQFNALLRVAKDHHPNRGDIQSLQSFQQLDFVEPSIFVDAVRRLKSARELRPPAAVTALLDEIKLPVDAATSVERDLAELREAATLGLLKTTLLLAGVIAESLLLARHRDQSERGPGLGALVRAARQQRLFGRDTLRQLETLVDYRDLIHPRAEVRNRLSPNAARIEAALSALKLLCRELEDLEARYAP